MCFRAAWFAGCALLAGSLAAQDGNPGNDALRGIDHNGRIPKAEIPAGLGHPDRWRYFPEGRLPQGDIFERFLITSFFSPLLFREADIGTGGGVAFTDVDFRNQRRQEFANLVATRSSRGQQTYALHWRRWTQHHEIPSGGVIQDERSYMHATASYVRSLTSRYFGRGPNRPAAAQSSYTRETSVARYTYQFTEPNPADDWVFRVGASVEHNHLASGRVRHVLDTRTAYTREFDRGNDHDLLWLNAHGRYDTRDSQHNPYRGWHLGATVNWAALQTGGDTGALFSVGGSKVFTMPPLFHHGGDGHEEHPPTDSLALAAFVTLAAGNLPFYALPSLGGSQTLRGYINGRWTDRSVWHAGAEYRFWVVPRGVRLTDWIRIERFGAALFVEAGQVGGSLASLTRGTPKYSYGVGLRMSLERTALFRYDLGFSEEGHVFSIAFGLSF